MIFTFSDMKKDNIEDDLIAIESKPSNILSSEELGKYRYNLKPNIIVKFFKFI